jgi:putative hydrolase of the HAD superfamily
MIGGTHNGAVVFDLDDTLHSARRFILSAYAAVAVHVERQWGPSRARVFEVLVRALRRGERARAFQALCDEIGLPDDVVPRLVDVVRQHEPSLRLPRTSADVLRRLRPRWRLGILTNGLPPVQAGKVAALGLERLVDAVVFADDVIAGGKPAVEAFEEVLRQLDVAPEHAWFVGNDFEKDVRGARSAGLRAVWLRRRGAVTPAPYELAAAEAIIGDLGELPATLARASTRGAVS